MLKTFAFSCLVSAVLMTATTSVSRLCFIRAGSNLAVEQGWIFGAVIIHKADKGHMSQSYSQIGSFQSKADWTLLRQRSAVYEGSGKKKSS